MSQGATAGDSGEEAYWSQYPDTLTIAEVAKITRMGAAAIRGRLNKGRLPGHRIVDSWVVFKPELRQWLAAHSNTPRRADYGHVLDGYPDELGYSDLMTLFRVKNKGTIHAWLRDGRLPGFKVDGRWVIHKWQLREFLDQQHRGATTE